MSTGTEHQLMSIRCMLNVLENIFTAVEHQPVMWRLLFEGDWMVSDAGPFDAHGHALFDIGAVRHN